MEITRERLVEILTETKEYCGQSVVNVWLDDGSYIVEATGNHRHERPYEHFMPFEAWYIDRNDDDDPDEMWDLYIENQVEDFFAQRERESERGKGNPR